MRALTTAVIALALLITPAIAEEKATTAEALLKQGLEQAKKEDKRVFVKFGAVWCGWCHKMDDFLNEAAMKPLFDKAFVIVRVDIEQNAGAEAILKEALGSAEGGVPSFAFLDADRKVLAKSTGTGENIGFPADAPSAKAFRAMLETAKTKLSAEEIKKIEDRLVAIGKELAAR